MAAEPKLVAELGALREGWGEGFDESVAQPLALVVRALREQYEAGKEDAQAQIEELHERAGRLEAELAESISPEEHEEMMEQLRDVSRGTTTLEEVMDRWRRERESA